MAPLPRKRKRAGNSKSSHRWFWNIEVRLIRKKKWRSGPQSAYLSSSFKHFIGSGRGRSEEKKKETPAHTREKGKVGLQGRGSRGHGPGKISVENELRDVRPRKLSLAEKSKKVQPGLKDCPAEDRIFGKL